MKQKMWKKRKKRYNLYQQIENNEVSMSISKPKNHVEQVEFKAYTEEEKLSNDLFILADMLNNTSKQMIKLANKLLKR